MPHILVIQTAFIGDAILATGIVESLHHHHPGASIDLLVRKGNETLFHQHPFLHEVLVWDKQQHKYRNLLRLLSVIRSRNYSAVVNIQRFAATGFLTVFSGAARKIGFDKNPWSRWFDERVPHSIRNRESPLHEVERNHALLRNLTDGPPQRPRLYPSPRDYAQVAPFQKQPYIVIAPASVWFTKQFPPEQWAELVRQLPEGYVVYLLGGKGDYPLAERIRTAAAEPRVQNLCGQFSFLESAALQQGAVMNYVNDSAPLHIASAMNAPVTAVYCSTLPQFGFGPLSDKRYVVETQESLACRPCGLHGRASCPQKHFRCAKGILVSQLLATLPV